METLVRLSDPALVARFQRVCGVRPVEAGESDKQAGNANDGSDTKYTQLRKKTSKQQNGGDGSYSTHNQNGAILQQKGEDTSNKQACYENGKPFATDRNHLLDQDAVTPEKHYQIDNKLLYYVFSLGAELGNEAFYIGFYPYFIWNLDAWMARRVIWYWSLFMYIGQSAKDAIKWPRPSSPPAFRLEKQYAFEYGMPSTHATQGVGIPYLILYLAMDRYEFNWAIGFTVATIWCIVVCLSRLYLGMHSVADVLVGSVLAVVLFPIWIVIMEPLDHFVLNHPAAPLLVIVIPLAMCLSYPTLEQWSTARADTFLVIGVASGIALSYWITHQYGLTAMPTIPGPYQIPAITMELIGQQAQRMLLGGFLALLTRAVFKTITYKSSCWYFGLDPADPKSKQQLCTELPTKFITYGVMALVTVIANPMLFKWLGIGRLSSHTEL